MKKVGVISITYPGAFIFTRKLCEEMEKLAGKDNTSPFALTMRPFHDYLDAARQDNYLQRWADLMLESAEELIAGGATIICCPANTNHLALSFFLPRLSDSVEFVSILDAVRSEVLGHGYTKVGILGTKKTVDSGMYDARLAGEGVDVVRLPANLVDELDSVIMDELVANMISDRAKKVASLGTQYLKEQGCDCVLSCCTELPMILEHSTDMPVIDSTDALARAVAERSI